LVIRELLACDRIDDGTKAREISGAHCGRGQHLARELRIGTQLRALVGEKEKQLVMANRKLKFHVPESSGKTQTLLNVANYDFNWQTAYYLEQPVLLPKGTRMKVTARYDNSNNNRINPNAEAEVYWGDQSWDERLAGFVDFVIPAPWTL